MTFIPPAARCEKLEPGGVAVVCFWPLGGVETEVSRTPSWPRS